MSKLTVEIFDSISEISEYQKTSSSLIEYLFNPSSDGYVIINDKSYKVKNGACAIDTANFSEREIRPALVIEGNRIQLPAMINCDGEFLPKDYGADFMRRMSLMELRLEKRIRELEKRADELSERVYRTTIF